MDFTSLQILVNKTDRLFSFSNGTDRNRSSVICTVTTCKDTFKVRCKGFFICDNCIKLCQFNSVHTFRVNPLANGQNNSIHINKFSFTFNWNRTAAAAGIRFTQLHFLKQHLLDMTIFIFDNFNRIAQVFKDNALFLRFLDLFLFSRHFRYRTAIHIVNFLCT